MSAPIIRYPDGTETILSGPIGTVIISPVATPPAHTLECNGAAISRAVYAKLFAVLGTQYGDGDGTTTFNVPNIDGVVYGTAA
ncbi:MAG: phage tail protein, partial [Synergistaceae bacterium]